MRTVSGASSSIRSDHGGPAAPGGGTRPGPSARRAAPSLSTSAALDWRVEHRLQQVLLVSDQVARLRRVAPGVVTAVTVCARQTPIESDTTDGCGCATPGIFSRRGAVRIGALRGCSRPMPARTRSTSSVPLPRLGREPFSYPPVHASARLFVEPSDWAICSCGPATHRGR